MRAFMVPEFGAPGSVGDRPKPEPGEGQILVRVRAAGVNAMDVIFRSGYAKDFMEHRFPLTPGLDYAGTVEAVGPGAERFAPGDEVFGAVGTRVAGEGSFAEYVAANAATAAKRPAGLAVDAAAALPTAAATALAAVDAVGAASGDMIAVIGAAGGVGGFATQLAANRGIRVIAVTKGEHADYVHSLGAADVVDYTAGDVVEQLRERAPGGLAGIVDVFHDAQGLRTLVPAVKAGGRIASSAAMGAEQAFEGLPVSVHPVRAATDRMGELGEMAALGRLSPRIDVLPLDRAAEALDRQGSRAVRGKLVVAID